MKKVLLSVLSFVSIIAANSASAAVYAAVALGRSSVNDSERTIPSAPHFFATPDSLPADTVPFDDRSTAWGMFAGVLFTSSLGVEVGYWHHGEFTARKPGTLHARLSIEELYIGPTLRYPIGERFSLTATAGVSHAKYQARGWATVPLAGDPPFAVPPPVNLPDSVEVALATPKDENGSFWNVGVTARVLGDLELGLSYGNRNLGIEHVKLASLSMLYPF